MTPDRTIAEEYKIWKKNVGFLYDMMMSQALSWPSLTAQWSPVKNLAGFWELLLGTHTSGTEQNFVIVASLHIPKDDGDFDASSFHEETGEFGGFGNDKGKIEIKQYIFHDGEVNRARYMPQNQNVFATKTISGAIDVFDRTKHESNLAAQEKGETKAASPQLRLVGHEKEGYALDWNRSERKRGYLLSGAEDGAILCWAVERGDRRPMYSVRGAHDEKTVESVSWHYTQDDIFASGGDDGRMKLWDLRVPPADPPKSLLVSGGAPSDTNAVAFSPHSEYLIATGSGDHVVRIFDIRSFKENVHEMISHSDDVLNVEWSPMKENVLASSSADRRVFVWDLSLIGEEQTPEDAEDGPPELLFVHGGHTSRVSDFGWHPALPWTFVSTAEDNIVQVWQPAESIYHSDPSEVIELLKADKESVAAASGDAAMAKTEK